MAVHITNPICPNCGEIVDGKLEYHICNDQQFLIQILRERKIVTNIAVWESEYAQYETDQGYIHDKFELDIFEYKHISWSDLRSLLNTDFAKRFLKFI